MKNENFPNRTRRRDLIWEVQGGYEEVNELAGKPAHIKAVRNELQTRSLSHCTTRTKRNKCMIILKAKIVRKVVHILDMIFIISPER